MYVQPAFSQRSPRKRKTRKQQKQKVQVLVPTRVPLIPASRNQQSKKSRKGGGRASGNVRSSNARARKGRNFPSGQASRGRRTTRICEDEYIAEVAGSTGFVTTQYPINPGQALTFPWLSKEALLWEKYRFEELEFYYRPEVSAFATNGQAGKVMLSCDYDASDPPPATKQQVEDTHPHEDAMPYESVILRLEPNEMYQSSDAKYVRPGGLPGSSDIKTYDCGNLFVSTIGNTNTSTVGELRVRYCVVFDVPVLENTAGAPQNNQVSWFQDGTEIGYTTATPALAPLATASANGLLAVNTAGSILLPAGNYLVDWYVEGEDSSAEQFTVSAELLAGATAEVTTSQGPILVAAAGRLSTYGSAFVSLNGSTALSLKVTLTGVAGTLEATASVRIVAI